MQFLGRYFESVVLKLTLFPPGKDTFYNRDSLSREKARGNRINEHSLQQIAGLCNVKFSQLLFFAYLINFANFVCKKLSAKVFFPYF